jgi:hypothetical protein
MGPTTTKRRKKMSANETNVTITVTRHQLAILEKLLDKELLGMFLEEREYFSGDFHKDSVKKLYDNICKI